jgi:hypothetical protein
MPGNVFYGNDQSSSLKTAREMLREVFDPAGVPNSYDNNAVPAQKGNHPENPVAAAPQNVGGAALGHPDFKNVKTDSIQQPEIQGAGDRLPYVMRATANIVVYAREAAAATNDQFALAA